MAIFSWMNKPWDRDQTPCPKAGTPGSGPCPGYSFIKQAKKHLLIHITHFSYIFIYDFWDYVYALLRDMTKTPCKMQEHPITDIKVCNRVCKLFRLCFVFGNI